MGNYFTDAELDDEIDRLCDMDPAGFAEVVDADVRGVAPAVTSAALQDPDVVDRWYEELVDMLDDIDSQFAALEPPTADENAITVDIDNTLETIVDTIAARLEETRT